MTKVLLVDHHRLFRAGLAALLSREGMTVIGEADDSAAAVLLAAALTPDVVLLELCVRDAGALAAIRTITADPAGVRVLITSAVQARSFLSQAVRAGASGYVLKGAEPSELFDALRKVAAGGSYHAALEPAAETSKAEAALTPRQREVLQLMAQGRSTREIAGELQVSVKTIETHRAQLMEKTGIRDVAGLVRLAIRMGLAGL